MEAYRYIVVGRGMVGAACAKHLAQAADGVALVGPVEPRDRKAHQGVFASHDDESRLPRTLDPHPSHALFVIRATERFRDIERRSGVRFFRETGHLAITPEQDSPELYRRQLDEVAAQHATEYEALDADELRSRFPALRFPTGFVGRYQRKLAGVINPRTLVQAQVELATKDGAVCIEETVTGVQAAGGRVEIHTDTGRTLSGDRVLFATGAFTNHHQFTSRPLALSCSGRTLVHMEIPKTDAEQLGELPTLIYRTASAVKRGYIVPPTEYPDGRTYVKIGGSGENEPKLRDSQAVSDWFRTDGRPSAAATLSATLREFYPAVEFLSAKTTPCVGYSTATDMPYIAPVAAGVYVAIAQGAAAKSTDELGLIAARMLAHGTWDYDMPPEEFAVRYAE